jgi:hypothetical protein
MRMSEKELATIINAKEMLNKHKTKIKNIEHIYGKTRGSVFDGGFYKVAYKEDMSEDLWDDLNYSILMLKEFYGNQCKVYVDANKNVVYF